MVEKEPISLEKMRRDVAEILHEDPKEIQDDDDLVVFGLDSIRAMMLFTKWREQAVYLSFADMTERPELGAWWALVQKSIKHV